jgi:hypothetical protein
MNLDVSQPSLDGGKTYATVFLMTYRFGLRGAGGEFYTGVNIIHGFSVLKMDS